MHIIIQGTILLVLVNYLGTTAFLTHSSVRSFEYSIRRTPIPSRTDLIFPVASTTKEEKDVDRSDDLIGSQDEDDSKDDLRPLHQNWWPVSAMNALQIGRPNALQVLGKQLVAFRGDDDVEWTVLDDRCSHRFAPLSEGRIVTTTIGQTTEKSSEATCTKTCIQCAYHGWEFATNGTCVKVPQLGVDDVANRLDKARPVPSYQTRVAAGILWVWTDPESYESLGSSICLPVNPILERFTEKYGDDACFMRDLPYGMEILGENLIDLSHLPYAHHSVGSLKREIGKELPTRMMSAKEREEYAKWELDYRSSHDNPVTPTLQAEIVDAAKHDPILKSFSSKINDPEVLKDWSCTISYFAPCHVRYRRQNKPGLGGTSHVELFMCPKSESRSRVFLYNVFGALLEEENKEKAPSIKERLQKAIIGKLFDPRRVAGHMLAHKIFDGDGIFLHMQGNRMKKAGLSFKDYSTPSSADVMLNAYRRFLDSLARKTRQAGLGQMADAVVGNGEYGDDLPRSIMLDRYQMHTIHCPTCSTALKQAQRRLIWMKTFQTAAIGAAGTSTCSFLVTLLLSRLSVPLQMLVPPVILRLLGSVTISAWLLTWAISQRIQKLDKTINQFLFEDYVHQDKL